MPRPDIALGHADYQAQIGLGQTSLGEFTLVQTLPEAVRRVLESISALAQSLPRLLSPLDDSGQTYLFVTAQTTARVRSHAGTCAPGR